MIARPSIASAVESLHHVQSLLQDACAIPPEGDHGERCMRLALDLLETTVADFRSPAATERADRCQELVYDMTALCAAAAALHPKDGRGLILVALGPLLEAAANYLDTTSWPEESEQSAQVAEATAMLSALERTPACATQ